MTPQLSKHGQHDIAVWFAKRATPMDCYRAFEAYGHAMTAASAFEMLMGLMVLKAFALRLDKRANSRIFAADRPQLLGSILQSTYDRLQRHLCNTFNLSKSVRDGLSDGKLIRDNLAHNFWQGHAGNLFSSDGVDIIATTCALHANHFRLLATSIFEETGVDAEDYVEMLLEAPVQAARLAGWNDLLQNKVLR